MAQLLPGLRELRGPLAAGFVWLFLGWVAFHDDLASATGLAKDVVRLFDELPAAARGAVASFIAYMVGSISADAFHPALEHLFEHASGRTPAGVTPIDELERRPMTAAVLAAEIARLENDEGRYRAEVDLRTALIPPVAALLLYLAIRYDGRWLLLCAALVGVLAYQAWSRARQWGYASDALLILRRRAAPHAGGSTP